MTSTGHVAGSALCKVKHRPGVPVGQGHNSFEVQGAEGRGKGCIHQRAEQDNHTAGRAKERIQPHCRRGAKGARAQKVKFA